MTNKKNFMAPFYVWGSTASRLQPLQGGSLLFTTKLQEIPGTTSERWKAGSTLEQPIRFEHGTSGLWIQRLNHYTIAPYLGIYFRMAFSKPLIE